MFNFIHKPFEFLIPNFMFPVTIVVLQMDEVDHAL